MNDIILDTDNEIQFLNGDFFVDKADNQHIQTMLQAQKGQFYESPLVGIGIANYLNGPFDRTILSKEIREQLQADGFNVKQIRIDKNVDELLLDIDAEEKQSGL